MTENQVNFSLHLVYASQEVDEAIRLCEDLKLASSLANLSELLHGIAQDIIVGEKEKAPELTEAQ